MANFNKVILLGRLVKKPEFVEFRNGGRVGKFSFAVSNRKKDPQSGEWVDDPMYVDCEVFNRGELGKQADTLEKLMNDRGLDKGWLLHIEGKLVQDRWEKDGQKQSKLKIVVDNFQIVSEPRGEGRSSGGGDDSGYSSRSSNERSGGERSGGSSNSGGTSRPKSSSSGSGGNSSGGSSSRGKPSRNDDDDMGSDDDIPF